jgi:hypothetical protein
MAAARLAAPDTAAACLSERRARGSRRRSVFLGPGLALAATCGGMRIPTDKEILVLHEKHAPTP